MAYVGMTLMTRQEGKTASLASGPDCGHFWGQVENLTYFSSILFTALWILPRGESGIWRSFLASGHVAELTSTLS